MSPAGILGSATGRGVLFFVLYARTLRAAFERRTTWAALAFALLAGAGFESAGAPTGPYLVDRGLGLDTIGWFRGLAVVGAMLAGALAGGVLADRWGKARASAAFLSGLVVIVAGLAAVEHRVPATGSPGSPAEAWLVLSILALMYLGCGLFVAASYALFMELTDARLGGTQFSLFMAATNGCESWSTWVGGQIVERGGYAASFLALSAVSLLALPLPIWLSRHARNARRA